DFQYSTDATALNTGTWTGVGALKYLTSNTAAATGKIDGNAAGNFTNVSSSISNLNIASGATFWIRWIDIDATDSDDGLAVDDFSLTAQSLTGTLTWNGGGANANWSTGNNWNAAPSSGSAVVFAGSTQTSNVNDSFPSAASIAFASGGGT